MCPPAGPYPPDGKGDWVHGRRGRGPAQAQPHRRRPLTTTVSLSPNSPSAVLPRAGSACRTGHGSSRFSSAPHRSSAAPKAGEALGVFGYSGSIRVTSSSSSALSTRAARCIDRCPATTLGVVERCPVCGSGDVRHAKFGMGGGPLVELSCWTCRLVEDCSNRAVEYDEWRDR